MEHAVNSGHVITAQDSLHCFLLTDDIVADLAGLIVATNQTIHTIKFEPQLALPDATQHTTYDGSTVVYTPLDPTDVAGSYYRCTRRCLQEICVKLPLDDEARCKAIYAKYPRVARYVPGRCDFGMRNIGHFLNTHPCWAIKTKGDAVIRSVLVIRGDFVF